MVGAKHDTMDPAAMEEQSKMVQKGRYLILPQRKSPINVGRSAGVYERSDSFH